MKDKIEYYLVIFLGKFLMLLPKRVRESLFKFLAKITYYFYSKNKRVIEANLKYVYNDKITNKQIQKIQKSCYQKLFLNILSIIENEYLTKNKLEKMITFENKNYLDEVLSTKKPFIYITGHIGNIDLLGLAIGKLIGSMVQVQQKLNNPLLTEYMREKREKYNLEIVEKHGAIKKLFLALKNGKSISLIIDQNVNPKFASKINFLNKKAYQTNSSSQLSKKFQVPILPIFIIEDKKNINTYKVIFKKPIYPEGKSEDELNQLQADVLSEIILEYPDEWFWCHKRFKNSNPSLYQK